MDINTSPLHSTVSTPATRPRSVMRPTPASQRSEWVMWVGNVPTDATPAELRAFFGAPDITPENGVLSIFVITHSRCALINYASDVHLHTAIARFDDVPLRAAPSVDLASPALSRQNQWPLSSSSPAARAARLVLHMCRACRRRKERSGDRMWAYSTTSSSSHSPGCVFSPSCISFFLSRYSFSNFHSQAALAASLATGTWATQNHVAPALTRAFRSDGEVFLVFGVNGEGTWAGCARCVWLATAPIPFAHTRHLRNTWNLDREVKVARDGTEVEPVAGRGLVGMWFVGEGLRGSQTEQWAQTQTQLPLFMPLAISGAKRTSGKKQKHSPQSAAARAEWWSRQSGSRVSEEAAAVMAA
ncbi:hypothetical protein C8R43DRAFT_1077009 [Mycena crocata]|nr:hypothetical protein C8R43DRAFT_1077009 [Mycena crocata]